MLVTVEWLGVMAFQIIGLYLMVRRVLDLGRDGNRWYL